MPAPAANPEQLVPVKVRVPDRLRTKAHIAAAVAGVSLSALVEEWLDQLDVPEAAQTSLPLAETA